MRAIAPLLTIAALACSCANTSHGAHDHGHDHGKQTNLRPADTPCPGPAGAITLRVLDSPTLTQDDPIAFQREPAISFIAFLSVVEVVKGDFEGERLGVLVHSPSMFASKVWGFGSSPQLDPAGLKLRWSAEFCLFEVTGVESPDPQRLYDGESFKFTVPQVHSALLESGH